MKIRLFIWILLYISQQVDAQLSFDWQKIYDAPFLDSNSELLTSTEVVDMVSHKGALYAATSNWNSPTNRFKGQVISKTSSGTNWILDEETQGRTSRASCIISVVFSTDKNGLPLFEQDTILFIGTTTHKGLQPTYPGKVAWRNDQTGNWVYHDLAYASHAMNRTEIRSLGFYRDKITQADIIFAGATPAPLGIFAGRYDASDSNKIVWDSVAEFIPVNFERILGFSECNGELFAATKSRILKRNDGDSVGQRWVELLNFLDPQYFNVYSQGLYPIYANDEDIRSFTTTTLFNPTREVLTFTTFNRLFHYDPVSETLTEEINIKDWLETETGKQYNYIQSGIISRFHTTESDTFQCIGIEAIFDTVYLAGNPQPNFEGIDAKGYIIARQHLPGGATSYQLLSISDPQFANDTLTRVRTIVNSPFPAETETIYAGGFAPWGNDVEHSGWVYKGKRVQITSLTKPKETEELVLFPNPAGSTLSFKWGHIKEPFDVYIYKGNGGLVLHQSNQNCLDISDLASGNYFIKLQTSHTLLHQKFIKQ